MMTVEELRQAETELGGRVEHLGKFLRIDEKSAESLWVDYKTFGNAILNFVFAMGTIMYLWWRYPEAREAFTQIEQDKLKAKDQQ